MKWVYDDGGRSKYFDAKDVGDCAVRSIAIATGKDYLEVYNDLKALNGGKSCRNGTPKKVDKQYLLNNGWVWHPTMTIGSGCQVHMDENELPDGTLIVAVSKHLTCVKNGVIYDTHDCSRGGMRCVYGYYTKKDEQIKSWENMLNVNCAWKSVDELMSMFNESEENIDAFKVLEAIDNARWHLYNLKSRIKGEH